MFPAMPMAMPMSMEAAMAMGPVPMQVGPMGQLPVPGGFGAMPVPAPVPVAQSTGIPLGPVARGGGNNRGAVASAVQATRKKVSAHQEGRHEMRERMRYIMHEVDECNGRFLSGRAEPFQFLDVCCCPGGFSTYSLTAGDARRKGIGLSLNPELGGHLPAIAQESEIYYMHFVDVTTVAAGVRVADMDVLNPGCPKAALKLDAGLLDLPSPTCHLVIADGSFLGGKDWIHKETELTDAENPAFNVYGTNAAAHKALLIAQLIIVANNLRAGGMLVLRLNMFPDSFTIGVLGLLRSVFSGDVCAYKPRSCHVHVGSYYLVCSGFMPAVCHSMEWVPRWHHVLTDLRNRGPFPKFVPFPGMFLDSHAGLQRVWQRPMYVYHVRLWRFLKLVETAMEEKAILDRRAPNRPRQGRFTNSCGRLFAGLQCRGNCPSGHTFEELHPFVQKAFKEPKGYLYAPGDPRLNQLVAYDPLPETVLELQQQEQLQLQVQAYAQAQAAMAQQEAVLRQAAEAAAAYQQEVLRHQQHYGGGGGAHGGAGHQQQDDDDDAQYSPGPQFDVVGQMGSYDNAVEMGMAGEWVHGLLRQQEDAEEAGEGALDLWMLGVDSEDEVVVEGGAGGEAGAGGGGEGGAEAEVQGGGFAEDDPRPPHHRPLPSTPQGQALAATVAAAAAAAQGPAGGAQGGGGAVAAGGHAGGAGDGGPGAVGAGPGPGSFPHFDDDLDPTVLPGEELQQQHRGQHPGGAPSGTPQPLQRIKQEPGVTPIKPGSVQGAGGGAAVHNPQLLRMSNYKPRFGLVEVEVEDDFSLGAMMDFMGS